MKKAAAILLSTLFAAQARADRWVNIDMEQWGIDCPGPSGEPAIQFGNIFNNTTGRRLGLEGNFQCPWITGSASYAGTKALGIWLKPTPDWKSRSEVHAIHYDDAYALKYGRIRYLGFAMYISNTLSDWPLAQNVNFMQAWESHALCSVPLVGTLVAGSSPQNARFRFRATFDQEHDPSEPEYRFCSAETIVEGPITIGEWHTFILRLQPNHLRMPGTGQITIWHQAPRAPMEHIANWAHDWGSLPNIAGSVPPTNIADTNYSDHWLVNTGAYRPDQPFGTFSTQNLVMLFDNIRVASTKEEAAP